MEAKDLRIGNLIISGNNGKFKENGVIGKVLQIGSEESEFEQIYCECDESYEWFFKGNYFGIPITEEWLIKFGFEKYIDGSYMFGIISIFKDRRLKENVYIFTEDRIYGGGWVVINDLKIKYVHQLQNLYYALTGEELVLNN